MRAVLIEPPPLIAKIFQRGGSLFEFNMKNTFNPNASWEKLVASQPAPTRENFDTLFAAGDRDAIILACLPLIKKYNTAPAAIREDVELYVLGEITREVDRMLQHPNANPGSYLIDEIRHAIHEAKFGTGKEARDCVSSNRRIYRPRPKASDPKRDKLIRKLELDGCSASMIEAELSSRGWDQSRVVEVEAQWPDEKARGSDGHFTCGHVAFDPGACDQSTDDWTTLAELHEAGILTDADIDLIDFLAAGNSHNEAAKELGCNVSTITTRLRKIKAKVQRHTSEN
jgi:DNA-binding CsgD family transcriptional regulator